jgi:hypothetical protein
VSRIWRPGFGVKKVPTPWFAEAINGCPGIDLANGVRAGIAAGALGGVAVTGGANVVTFQVMLPRLL